MKTIGTIIDEGVGEKTNTSFNDCFRKGGSQLRHEGLVTPTERRNRNKQSDEHVQGKGLQLKIKICNHIIWTGSEMVLWN